MKIVPLKSIIGLNQKKLFSFLLLILLQNIISSTPSQAQLISNRIVPAHFRSLNLGNIAPNEIIIKTIPGAPIAQINALLSKFGIRRLEENIRNGTQRLIIPSGNLFDFLALLNQDPLIAYAEPNYFAQAELIPNDPYYIYQWNLSMINMESAWDISIGENILVAVIDTGIAYENNGIYALAPDFANTIFIPGWDFVNDDAFADDDNGHGTHIAGTIAQSTNNLLGVAGIAHGCTIMPVKVLDGSSNGLISDIADGIYYAVNNGAQIINMSFGTYTASLTLEEAVNYAYLNGVTVISSAGNSASSALHYPSSYPNCICVGAVRYDQTRPFYANYGADLDICAPGGDLSVDQNLDGHPDGICQQTHDGTNYSLFEFALYQGTSCAAAHASGVAALIQSVAGGLLKPDLLKATLETTAIDLGTVGWDQDYGWGLINAFNAIQSVFPTPAATIAGSLLPLQPIQPISPLITPYSLIPLNLLTQPLNFITSEVINAGAFSLFPLTRTATAYIENSWDQIFYSPLFNFIYPSVILSPPLNFAWDFQLPFTFFFYDFF